MPNLRLIFVRLLGLARSAGAWAALPTARGHDHHVRPAGDDAAAMTMMDCEHPDRPCCHGDDACATA
ncbi:MAG: hypothetical protein L0H29_10040, partial [Sinobacteraceae bacterium]|nr:hypothetical protein [Nevskiaceae bacterium]